MRSHFFPLSGRVVRVHVVVENLDELGHDMVAFESSEEASIYVDGSFRFFEGTGQRNSEARVLGFSGAVDDAAHDRDFHFLNAGVGFFPDLNLLGHLLKESTGGAAASGAGGDLRSEAANS